MAGLQLPSRGRGRPTPRQGRLYNAAVREFCEFILEISSRLDFEVSSRGWCYLLESSHGLSKADFDKAQDLINDCRKSGLLPVSICAEDNARISTGGSFLNTGIDTATASDYAADCVEYSHGMAERYLEGAHNSYNPVNYWSMWPYYIEMYVEKIDLFSLFEPVCRGFHVRLQNAKGWSDLNSRAGLLQRFHTAYRAGKKCVLLYCGDHDPAGLQISEYLRANLYELRNAQEVQFWFEEPDDLIIDRFGLNYDFIQANNLTWIENLDTGSGKSLADPRHPDFNAPYAREYRERFGIRKVEANALVVAPEAGRKLCLDAIIRYLPLDAPDQYRRLVWAEQQKVKAEIEQLLGEE
jgi:hypothetical protein